MLEDSKASKKIRTDLTAHFKDVGVIEIDSGKLSMEAVAKSLADRFAAKIILVKHESSLRSSVDTSCANLAIRHNCLYLSAYQIIKKHIEEGTEWGQWLSANKCERAVAESVASGKDTFQEAVYSAAHFPLDKVLLLLKETIAKERTNQKLILLEGFGNSSKLAEQDDQLALR